VFEFFNNIFILRRKNKKNKKLKKEDFVLASDDYKREVGALSVGSSPCLSRLWKGERRCEDGAKDCHSLH
jgi:hypothetical protein